MSDMHTSSRRGPSLRMAGFAPPARQGVSLGVKGPCACGDSLLRASFFERPVLR